MIYLAATLAVASFFWFFRWLGVLDIAMTVLDDSRGGFAVLSDPGLNDHQKEKLARQTSLRLMKHAGALLLRTAVALAPSALIILAFVWFGYGDLAALLALLESWWFLALLVLAFAADLAWRAYGRR